MDWGAAGTTPSGLERLSAARGRAIEEASYTIARQLTRPLTVLSLFIGGLKRHSHRLSPDTCERDYQQQVVQNALQQTERVCALVKQMGGAQAGTPVPRGGWQRRVERDRESYRPRIGVLGVESGQRPLTRRERVVLRLISEGCNKEGALRMQISPRTFESQRPMRKLGARNTADLVRAALLDHLR